MSDNPNQLARRARVTAEEMESDFQPSNDAITELTQYTDGLTIEPAIDRTNGSQSITTSHPIRNAQTAGVLSYYTTSLSYQDVPLPLHRDVPSVSHGEATREWLRPQTESGSLIRHETPSSESTQRAIASTAGESNISQLSLPLRTRSHATTQPSVQTFTSTGRQGRRPRLRVHVDADGRPVPIRYISDNQPNSSHHHRRLQRDIATNPQSYVFMRPYNRDKLPEMTTREYPVYLPPTPPLCPSGDQQGHSLSSLSDSTSGHISSALPVYGRESFTPSRQRRDMSEISNRLSNVSIQRATESSNTSTNEDTGLSISTFPDLSSTGVFRTNIQDTVHDVRPVIRVVKIPGGNRRKRRRDEKRRAAEAVASVEAGEEDQAMQTDDEEEETLQR